MCRLLQSVVKWTGVCPAAARVFFPHDIKNKATARVHTETRLNRTHCLRFHCIFMSLSTPVVPWSAILLTDDSVRPIDFGLGHQFSEIFGLPNFWVPKFLGCC